MNTSACLRVYNITYRHIASYILIPFPMQLSPNCDYYKEGITGRDKVYAVIVLKNSIFFKFSFIW